METLFYAGLSNAVTATFLALLVACSGRFLAKRPVVLHCLWLLVLLKFVTPPLYEVAVPWPRPLSNALEPARTLAVVPLPPLGARHSQVLTPSEQSSLSDIAAGELAVQILPPVDSLCESGARDEAAGARSDWSSIDWMGPLAFVWVAGTVATLAVAAIRIRRFGRVLREARPAEVEIQEWVHDLAMDLGLRRTPSVWWIGGKLSPLVWGVGLRPRMIIPEVLWKSLDERQRTTLMVHELAHLRRGDHAVRIFELLVTALYWWHPVLWWARQALRDVEEQCCDAWVVWAFPDAARSYAETLLETLDFLNQSPCAEPLLASGFGKVHHLRKRLTMIMSGTTPRFLGVRGALCCLGLAALLLPVNATWAQKPETQKEIRVVVEPSVSTEPITVTELDEPETFLGKIVEPETFLGKIVEPETFLGKIVEPETFLGKIVANVESAKPERFQLEITTDDETTTVKSDSFDEALAQIKHLLGDLGKKPSLSDQDKARLKTLERVAKELESITKKDKDRGADAGKREKLNEERRYTIVRRIDDPTDKPVSKETKAEIEKAQAKVKELSQSLKAKQKELAEAQNKLARLQLALLQEGGVITKSVTVGSKLPRNKGYYYDYGTISGAVVPITPGTPLTLPTPATTAPGLRGPRASADAKRLEELEKKLDKLLEEVASLKKDRNK